MSLTLLATPTPPAPLAPPVLTGPPALTGPVDSPGPAPHWAPGSLPSCLHADWLRLCAAPGSASVLTGWAAAQPALAGFNALEQFVPRIADADLAARDAVLLALLALAKDGDRLAGRVVLQVMLPKAVRLATSIVRRPDVLGDRDEAQASAIAAMWQAIATYPLAARPGRVTANLALDTLALLQRGHTGSSHFARTFPEQPFGDLRELGEAGRYDVEPDESAGPVDAELLVLLAWAVRNDVLDLDQARLLARVYAIDGRPADTAAVAAEHGVSWSTLRQRCHRLARRLGQAAIAAGISPGSQGQGGRAMLAAA